MTDEDREDQLRARQDGRVYPLGRALRSTYGADNHDTLGADVTGLMIDLSKVPFERDAPAEARPSAIDLADRPAAAAMPPCSWRRRLSLLWGRAGS